MQQQQDSKDAKPLWLLAQDRAQISLQLAQRLVDEFRASFASIELIGGPNSKDGKEALARAWSALEKANHMYEVADQQLNVSRDILSADLAALKGAAASEEADAGMVERTKKPLEALEGFLEHTNKKIEAVQEQRGKIEAQLKVARESCGVTPEQSAEAVPAAAEGATVV